MLAKANELQVVTETFCWAQRPSPVRLVKQGTMCVVQGAMCVVQGAMCVVQRAMCVVQGAICVV